MKSTEQQRQEACSHVESAIAHVWIAGHVETCGVVKGQHVCTCGRDEIVRTLRDLHNAKYFKEVARV